MISLDCVIALIHGCWLTVAEGREATPPMALIRRMLRLGKALSDQLIISQ